MVFPTIMPANSVSGGYEVDNSLRLNGPDSAYLNRTATAGNRKTWTWSGWVKLVLGGNGFSLMRCWADDDNFTGLTLDSNGQFSYISRSGGGNSFYLNTTPLLRDPSAWYHFVIASDTTQGTAANRVKFYVNGVQITAFDSASYPAEDSEFRINENNIVHKINRLDETGGNGTVYSDAYLAEHHFIDGAAKAPTDFGETDDNGVWIPKEYDGDYGTNGYYLEFKETGTSANASGIGADTSGETNHWAVNNLAATDVMIDTPTNNFATMNPLLTDTTTVAFSEGNLKTVCTNASTAGSSIAVQNGKWYVEMICTAKSATNAMIGVCTVDGFDGQRQLNESQNGGSGYGYVMNGNKLGDGGGSYGASWAVDDIMGIALDLDTAQNTVTFYKNNASQGAIDIDTALYVFAQSNGQGSSTVTYNTNFGADDTFAGEISSAGNTDANGEGLFKYTPPSGHFALNTKNLAEFG